MNEPVREHSIIHLHNKVISALAKATAKSPVALSALSKLAERVFDGEKILGQFLEQLIAAKAIASSTGMLDGKRFVNYWPTDSFGDVATQANAAATARSFTAAEKGLIRKVHGFMPAKQLLDILNERLVSDLGPDAVPYTMGQLYGEIGDASGAPAGGHDWPSLRKLLAKAERDGVLNAIDEQTIDDFAVVFSLNSKQVMVLKDIILQAKEAA